MHFDLSLDDGDDDDEDDGANSFFKKLYNGAAPEVQRAMMKSYTESNGTSLSTNWEEVSKGKVETLQKNLLDLEKIVAQKSQNARIVESVLREKVMAAQGAQKAAA